ncbi:MAG: hypothetical protein KH441_07305 [Clostridium sp.]|nr:hypothetical protein [Clostridium sp.]
MYFSYTPRQPSSEMKPPGGIELAAWLILCILTVHRASRPARSCEADSRRHMAQRSLN